MESTHQPSRIDTKNLAEDMSELVGAKYLDVMMTRLADCRVLPKLTIFRELAHAETHLQKAQILQEVCIGALVHLTDAEYREALRAFVDVTEVEYQEALRALVTFGSDPEAKIRRANAARALRCPQTTVRDLAHAIAYREDKYLRPSLVSALVTVEKAAQESLRASIPFQRWIESWAEDRLSLPTVGPVDIDRALDDAVVLDVTPNPALDIKVRFRELSNPTRADLGEDLVAAMEARSRVLAKESGKNRFKVSVDYLQLPNLDNGQLTVAYHQEPWILSKAFHDELPRHAGVLERLSRWAADPTPEFPRWPGILCNHGVVTLLHEGEPYAVWIQRSKFDPETESYSPGAWSCSFEEQFEPGKKFSDECWRGLREEMGVEVKSDLQLPPKLIAVILEQRILNLSLITYSFWPGTWPQFLKAYDNRDDRNENYQVAAFPMSREVFRQLSEGSEVSPTIRNNALVGRESRRFTENDIWDLHPTSLTRMALALWIVETNAAAA